MTKLLNKFNDNIDNIYNRFSARKDSPDEAQPYVEIKPNKNGNISMKYEDQTSPVISTARDLERIGKFLKSPRGIRFLAKQALLQTGNTFSQTRIVNPLFVAEHTIPFVHAKRHLALHKDGLLGIFGKENNDGLLQKETADIVNPQVQIKLKNKGGVLYKNDGLNVTISKFTKKGITNTIKSFINSFKNQLTSPIKNALGLNTLGGDWNYSRPELSFNKNKSYLDTLLTTNMWVWPGADGRMLYFESKYSYQSKYSDPVERGMYPSLEDKASTIKTEKNKKEELIRDLFQSTIKRLKTGKTIDSIITNNSTFEYRPGERVSLGYPALDKAILPHLVGQDSRLDEKSVGEFNARAYPEDSKKRKRYFKDLTQLSPDIFAAKVGEMIGDTNVTDIIDVIFRVKERNDDSVKDAVRFRAFISDVAESVTPDYSETKYIGRIERFYTYQGVVRDVNMTLYLQAFSEDELRHIWKKVDYLGLLAYPLDFVGGYIKPTVFDFTLGNVYVKQPAILMKLDYNFDDGGVWDIDEQLPQGVTITLQLRLLDRKVYNYNNILNNSLTMHTVYSNELALSAGTTPTAVPSGDSK